MVYFQNKMACVVDFHKNLKQSVIYTVQKNYNVQVTLLSALDNNWLRQREFGNNTVRPAITADYNR